MLRNAKCGVGYKQVIGTDVNMQRVAEHFEEIQGSQFFVSFKLLELVLEQHAKFLDISLQENNF